MNDDGMDKRGGPLRALHRIFEEVPREQSAGDAEEGYGRPGNQHDLVVIGRDQE